MVTIYTAVQTLTAGSPGQTSFTIDAVDNATDSFILYTGASFPYGIDYTISSTTLTWSGVTLGSGDKLHLVSNPQDVDDIIYAYEEDLAVANTGQTTFQLTRTPTYTNGALAVYSLIGFTSGSGVISISGSTLTWAGVTLTAGETIKVYYG